MKTVLAASAALLLPLASLCVADDLKPFDAKLGLWEVSTTMEMAGMPTRPMPQIPPEKLAQMPAAQRAQVEAMMKTASGAPSATVTKSCVTAESLSRGSSFSGNRASSCTHKVVSQTATTMQVHMECQSERGSTTGDVTVERIDGTHVKTSAIMKTSGDRPMTMKMNSTQQWISADCGDVKPILPKQ